MTFSEIQEKQRIGIELLKLKSESMKEVQAKRTLSKQGLLKELEKLGKKVQLMNTDCETNRYLPALTRLRKVYFNVNNDLVNPVEELKTLQSERILSGIESNHLGIIILALEGRLDDYDSWKVSANDGCLVFNEKALKSLAAKQRRVIFS